MTTRFNLGSGADLLSLGFDGSVSQGNKTTGNWRTGVDNSIQVKFFDGTARTFAVSWAFNATNQLVLSSDGAAAANFQSDAAVRPGFELRKGVLRVTPNRLAGFAFELRGDWALTPEHDLQWTVGGKTSKLAGLILDPNRRNRFLFMFHDSTHPVLIHQLAFEGHWETPAGGEANLRYVYVDKDGKDQVFELPGKLVINRSTNQLRYEYTKNGNQSIEFDGSLSVTPDLQLTYAIGRTRTQTGDTVVTESVLSIGAKLTKNSFTGDLEFEARRIDGEKTSLAIAGSFVGVLGPGVKVAAGFSFRQVRAANQVTQTTVGFEGSLQFRNGSTVDWVFTSSNAATRTISLSLNADIVLNANASADARLNLTTENGKVQSVSLLLGVRF